jgi:hypothetical protein
MRPAVNCSTALTPSTMLLIATALGRTLWSRSFQAQLQEGEGEHRHEPMAVKTLPGSPFEVVEAQFLFGC